MTDAPTPEQIRDVMPFAVLVAKVTQTQAFHYPRG
jgi:hypothetical protein